MHGTDQPALPTERLSSTSELWYTRCPIPNATGVAITKGYLQQEFSPDGITIKSLVESPKRSVRESHFDHSQKDSFRQGGNIPPLWGISRGADLAIIGLSWVDEYQSLIALPDGKIRRPEDLKGARLGLPTRMNDQIDFYRAMCLRGYLNALAVTGISPKEVEFVDLPVEESYIPDTKGTLTGLMWTGGVRARRQRAEVFALIKGEIDIMYSSGAAGLYVRDFLGAIDVLEFGFHPDPKVRGGNMQPSVLTASRTLCEKSPEVVARYLRQLLNAANWAKSNRIETVKVFAEDESTPFEWAALAHGQDSHLKLEVTLDEDRISALESQKQFLLENKFLNSDFDLRAAINPQPLELALARG